ncbi:MAG TPA: hypothetical protein GXZ77_05860, partial [Papillibacter sp.]|nr:hypothetical protein [Papillibacter sp.]
MRINTNLTAMNTFTQYTANNNKIAGAVAKLSSGYAINTAADNAAGLAISEKMRAQIRGLTKASANAQDAISLVQTAEGSLGEATEILQRMRELAVQASSDTNENEIDRAALQDEFAQLQQELNDIASTTTFNKKNLLDGSLAASQRTVNNVTLANSGMAVSVGKAAAGSYNFGVVIRQESAAVVARAGTATAAMGSVASATFTDVDTVDPTIEGALYNGNYTLETDIKDGNLTVKAQGDNGQTFYATLSKSDIEANLINGWNDVVPSANVLTLSFASADGAGDGFDIELTLANKPSTSENGLLALKSAIDDVTVSVDGGVNAQDATYGVYASLTGGESVKLNAGDTSVTFSNGVTVSFDKLTTTDVAVDTVTTAGYSYELDGIPSTVDIKGAFGISENLTMAVTSIGLNNGENEITGLTVKNISADTTTATFTLTDGTNDYTGSIDVATIKALNAGSTSLTLNHTTAGSVTISIATTDDLTGVNFDGSGSAITSGDAANIASTSDTVSSPSLSQGLLTKLGSSDDVTAIEGGAAVGVTTTSTF